MAVVPLQPKTEKLGRPFTLGDVTATLQSVTDPFPPAAGVQPAPGHRLVSISYEFVNQSPVTLSVSDLPAVTLRDSGGAGYQSEHGRLSIAAGARLPGELPAGKHMETSALFEVPASATGLEAFFRPVDSGAQGATVALG